MKKFKKMMAIVLSLAVVLALMLGTGREITSFDAVVEQPWASVTVTV